MPKNTRRLHGGVKKVKRGGGNIVKLEGYCPLVNGNNRCYMNAAIQMLYSIPEMRKFFKSANVDTLIINTDAVDCTDNKQRHQNSLKALKLLFDTLESKPTEAINTQTLKIGTKSVYDILLESGGTYKEYATGKTVSELVAGEQEDAHSFLTKILEIFECYSGDEKVKLVYDSHTFNLYEKYKCANITNLKRGTITAKSTSLSFELPEVGENDEKIETSIQNIIDNFSKDEPFTQIIEVCRVDDKTNVQAIFKQQHIEIPDTIQSFIFSLKRFDYSNDNKKINRLVEVSPEITVDDIRFQIHGIIRHIGDSPKAGHYIYQIYKNGKSTIVADDIYIRDSTDKDNENVKSEGYIYIYRKVLETNNTGYVEPYNVGNQTSELVEPNANSNTGSVEPNNGGNQTSELVGSNVSVPITPDTIELPFQTPTKYSEIWSTCELMFNEYSKRTNTDELTSKGTAMRALIYHYKDLITQIYAKFSLVDKDSFVKFFDILESTREYHARALITLCSMKEETFPKYNTGDDIEQVFNMVYTFNEKTIQAYEMPFVVNPLLYLMANWEWKTHRNEALKEFSKNPIPSNSGHPLHLEVLSEKYGSIELYPQSVLMNYSMFYPFILHPSGKAQNNPIVTSTISNANANANANNANANANNANANPTVLNPTASSTNTVKNANDPTVLNPTASSAITGNNDNDPTIQ